MKLTGIQKQILDELEKLKFNIRKQCSVNFSDDSNLKIRDRKESVNSKLNMGKKLLNN